MRCSLALVLVFTVTRIVWIPCGEFVAWGTLTLASLQLGKAPGVVQLLVGLAIIAGIMEIWQCVKRGEPGRLPRRLAVWTGAPLVVALLVWLAPLRVPFPFRCC
jgi:branched-chain amino acid transport system permease protein